MWMIQSFMARPERVYAFLSEAGVPNHEVLLVPLYAGQPDPLGTLWVISHEEAIHFDSGDARVMTELAAFAGLALKMIQDASVLRASEARLPGEFRVLRCCGRKMIAPSSSLRGSRADIDWRGSRTRVM
jgi:hypothetical protein